MQIVDSMVAGDFRFANMGEMHAASDFASRATYYCGLLPHSSPLPWAVTFRNYAATVDASSGALRIDQTRRGARWSRYDAADIAVGVYTGVRFLRTRANALRDTYLSRHPANRVFFFVGERDPLALFDAVVIEGAGESYNSALRKQLYGLLHMWQTASDAQWY